MSMFKRINPGGQLSARSLNNVQDTVEILAKLTAATPLEVVRQGDGFHLRINPDLPLVANVLVTGAAEVGPGGLDYYPGQVDLFDGTAGTFFQTWPVWLVSRDGSALGETGSGAGSGAGGGIYIAVLQPAAVSIDDDGRPVYVTAGAGACPAEEGSGSGDCPGGTPLGDLIRCDDGSGSGGTQIRDVCLAVNVCGRLYPVVALDPVTGEILNPG